jgi:formylglycine-generating enzyme required for sulfatase activity
MKTKGRRIAITTGLVALILLALGVWRGWPHLVFWYRFEPLGVNAQGYPEYRHRQTGIVMVRLPGGKFWMGAQAKDPNGPNCDPDSSEDEGPVHEVALSPFLLAKHEVTQVVWKRVMGDDPSDDKGDALPVERVSWEACQAFCARTGSTLPTEAQWEYACRAATAGPRAGTGRVDDAAWYAGNSGDEPHPVGTKLPNGFGLHDLQGNADEWCLDVYDEEYYRRPEGAGPDPCSLQGSENRILRGGSYYRPVEGCRASFRGSYLPEREEVGLGFRPAYHPLP